MLCCKSQSAVNIFKVHFSLAWLGLTIISLIYTLLTVSYCTLFYYLNISWLVTILPCSQWMMVAPQEAEMAS